jgi:ABC-type nitrate/sulfonate/bicarbonate transport system permease component
MFEKTRDAIPAYLLSAKGSRPQISALSVTLFLVLWEILPRAGLVDAQYVSQPSKIITAAGEIITEGDFLSHLYISAIEFFAGFFLALVIGVLLGMIIGAVKEVRYLLDPPLMALWSTPRLALMPILIVWAGIGVESKILVVFLGAVIPIIVNTTVGIREADFILIQAARSFCAKRRDIFIKVLLPGSLPAMMAGIRLGLGRAILGVVVAEMYVSTKGIGNQIMHYGQSFHVGHLLFYVSVVSFFGFAATTIVRELETRLISWRET